MTPTAKNLTDKDFQRLLELHSQLRRFVHWTETQAKEAGITPAQHQLMLAIRGHDDPRGPAIGEVANYMMLRHHSVVGLTDRAEEAGLVERKADPDDHRVVRLRLTRKGANVIQKLNGVHAEELSRLGRGIENLKPPEG